MITLFKKGDIVTRYLVVAKKDSHKAFTMKIFIGQSNEETPSENPMVCDNVVLLDRHGVAECIEGLVDFSRGFSQDVIGSIYHVSFSEPTKTRPEHLQEYLRFLEEKGVELMGKGLAK